MTPEQWRRVNDLYHAALDTPPFGRMAFVAQQTEDPLIRDEVARLLAIDPDRTAALDQAAVTEGLLTSFLAPTLSAGEMIMGRYRIVREVGAGGMGRVYEAFDEELHTRIGLKIIRPELAEDPRVLSRFKQEVQLARQVTHPNVCRTYDLVRATHRERDLLFLCMEFVEGETLAARLRQREVYSLPEAAPVIEQIAAGLSAAHAAGVVHRDLKSGNIFLSRNREDGLRVVIGDFGLAGNFAAGAEVKRQTGSGWGVGTPAYMAPEQVEGGKIGPAADIYALGIVMYEMATGRLPYDGLTPLQVAVRRLKEKPRPPRELRMGIDAKWEAAILRCLEIDPADRFRQASEIPEALRQSRYLPALPRRARRKMGAVAALLLLGAVAGWFWSGRLAQGEAQRFYEQGVIALADAAPLRGSRLFEAAIQREPGFLLAHARRGQALAALDSPDLARESLLRALELRNRKFLFSAYERHLFDAIRATVTRDYAVAEERFARAAESAADGEKSAALLDLGMAQEAAEKVEAAAKTYAAVLQREPNHPTVLLRLGMLASRRADLPGALGLFEKAQRGYELLGNVEGTAETWIRRGQAAARLSRYPAAREALEAGRRYAASNRLPSYEVRALFGLSNVTLGMGEMSEARRLAEEALRLARSEKQEAQIIFAMNDLSNALLSQFKLKETDFLARQALDLAERYRQPQSAARARLILMIRFTMAATSIGLTKPASWVNRRWGSIARAVIAVGNSTSCSCWDASRTKLTALWRRLRSSKPRWPRPKPSTIHSRAA
ncbi:MAG: protein kinase [Bryobacteraceae bacterium]|nr:protein kinase [Bryobacteraceae bacterium]